MSDYMPTTEEVRDALAYDEAFYEPNGDWINLRDEIAACFDRWLAAHDAEVRADERRAIASAVFNEEQRALAIQLPDLDKPSGAFRSGYVLGLQRARDIAEGFQRIAAARGDGSHE